MGKKSSPPPVNYTALAQQQAEQSKATAEYNASLNRVNQVNPQGTLTWSRQPGETYLQKGTASNGAEFDKEAYLKANPDVQRSGLDAQEHFNRWGQAEGRQGYWKEVMAPGQDVWTQTVSLSPEQQRLYDTSTRIQQNLADTGEQGLARVGAAMGTPFDMSKVRSAATTPTGGITATSPELVSALRERALQTSVPGQQMVTSGPNAASYQSALVNPKDAMEIFKAAPSVSAGGGIARDFDTSGVRKLPGQIDDTSRRRVEEALMSRLNPQYQADEQALRTRLLNSGIEVGTDAYNREMANFSQRLNDARMQAVLAGGQEESRQVGLTQGLAAQEFDQLYRKAKFGQDADVASSAQALQASIANAQFEQNNRQALVDAYLRAGGLNLQTNAQNFNQDLASRTFENSGKTAQLNADLAAGQFANNAQTAAFQQDLAAGQFANDARGAAADRQLRIDQAGVDAGLRQAQFQQAARSQDMQEQAWLRSLPLNELTALVQGAQVQMPQFGSYYTGGAAQAPQLLDAGIAQGNYNAAAAQAKQSGMNALMGGLANLGSAWIASSDIRLKSNIQRIGTHASGLGWYTWDWASGKGSSHGVLAQEVAAVMPAAVLESPAGHLLVNYAKLNGVA